MGRMLNDKGFTVKLSDKCIVQNGSDWDNEWFFVLPEERFGYIKVPEMTTIVAISRWYEF